MLQMNANPLSTKDQFIIMIDEITAKINDNNTYAVIYYILFKRSDKITWNLFCKKIFEANYPQIFNEIKYKISEFENTYAQNNKTVENVDKIQSLFLKFYDDPKSFIHFDNSRESEFDYEGYVIPFYVNIIVKCNISKAIFLNRFEIIGVDNKKLNLNSGFLKTEFHGEAIFHNIEFTGVVYFKHENFKKFPPMITESTLPNNARFSEINEWVLPKTKEDAGYFVRAYEELGNFMKKQERKTDEHKFFRLEMKSRAKELGWFKGFAYNLYDCFGDYGFNPLKPLGWLGFNFAAGAGVFWYFACKSVSDAITLSLANVFNFLNLRKDFFTADVLSSLSGWLKFMSGVQTITGVILIFLIGLCLRNQFRMK